MPFGAGDYEPGSRVSFLNDNRNRLTTRITHRLRCTPDGLRIARKKVELVNSTSALPNMAFII